MSNDEDQPIPRWRTIESKVIAQNPFLTVEEHTRKEDGRIKTAEFIIINAPDWANISAITTDGYLVMIEQFRQGTESVELEVPGGIIDSGEDPEAAVLRELLEETGYEPTEKSKIQKIGEVHPNPAFLTNQCHFYAVTNVKLSGKTSFDENENIRVKLVSLAEVETLVKTGQIRHALVIAALYYLSLSGI